VETPAQVTAARAAWSPWITGTPPWRGGRLAALEWAGILFVLLADAIAAPALGFRLASSPRPTALAVCILLIAGVATGRRLGWPRLEAPCTALLRLIVLLAAAGVLQYLAAVAPSGTADPALAALDRALGFDWPRVYDWTMAHPVVVRVLGTAYRALGWEMIYVILFLGAVEPPRAGEFVTALTLALLVTISCLALLPAAGAFVEYGHADVADAGYAQHYLALRAGELRSIDFRDIRGIVSFPSFHAAAALLCLAAVWRYRLVFWPMLLLDAVILAATPVIGGHYLVDLLGGGAVAAAAVAGTRRLYRAASSPR
jgi:hypothetical protein